MTKFSALLTFFFSSIFLTNSFATLQEPVCNPSLVTLLSVDGGGVLGVIPAVILEALEEKSHEPVAQLFDFMSGVSTGTIVVSILTTPNADGSPKYPAKEVITLFKKKSGEIFSSDNIHALMSLGGLIGPKYDNNGMEKVAEHYLGDITVSQLLSHVVLFGYDITTRNIVAFANWKDKSSNIMNYKVKNILAGTTAVMAVFSPKILYDKKGNERHKIIDTALSLNNPVVMAYLYAQNKCPDAKHYLIVSLGTGKTSGVNIDHRTNWGLAQWIPDIIKTTIIGEQNSADLYMLSLSRLFNKNNPSSPLPKVTLVRINPSIPNDQSDPIDASPEHLVAAEDITNKYVEKHQVLIDCLAKILASRSPRSLDTQCLDVLKKQHTASSQLWLNV